MTSPGSSGNKLRRTGHLINSFSMEDNQENRNLLTAANILARKDNGNFSEFVRKALLEYVERHTPGNPQLDLGHWSNGLPMPVTIQEREVQRVRAVRETRTEAQEEAEFKRMYPEMYRRMQEAKKKNERDSSG